MRASPYYSKLGFKIFKLIRMDPTREHVSDQTRAMLAKHGINTEYGHGDKRSDARAESNVKQIELSCKAGLLQTALSPEWFEETADFGALCRNNLPRAKDVVS